MSADLDVQLVAYGDVDGLRRAIASTAGLRPDRLIVVDHRGDVPHDLASDADLPVVVRSDPTNPGFGAGHNAALREGTSPYVLMLNPDATVHVPGIVDGLAFLRSNPGVAAVQGTIVNEATGEPERSHGVDLRPVHLAGRALKLRALLALGGVRRVASRSASLRDHVERTAAGPAPVDAIAATAVLVRREAMAAVGGFDEAYFLYGEDLDLCRRLRDAGWTLVALDRVFATHRSGGSSASSWQRELQWWQGTLQYAARWWSWSDFLLAMLFGLVVVARLAVGRPTKIATAARALVLRPVAVRRGRAPRAVRAS